MKTKELNRLKHVQALTEGVSIHLLLIKGLLCDECWEFEDGWKGLVLTWYDIT